MEVWKKTKFKNYSVSNTGKIRNDNTKKVLKNQINSSGYESILLYEDGKIKHYQVHRLVLETFKPIKNMDKLQVNHINYKRDDNIITNLEWVTNSQNCNRKKQKKQYYNSIKCKDNHGNIFNSYREAGKFWGISPNTVKRDVLRITKYSEQQKGSNFERKVKFEKI